MLFWRSSSPRKTCSGKRSPNAYGEFTTAGGLLNAAEVVAFSRDPPEKLVVNSLDTMISGCIPNSLIGINPGGRSAVCARIVEMIRKVYEVDPMVCPKCGGTKKVIAFITEVALMEAMRTSKAAVVDRIIDHLKLRFVAAKPPPSHVIAEPALPAAASACTQGDEFAAP